MKNIKYLFTFILFVMTLGLHAQEVNRLEVQSVIGAAGKDVNIPIALTNDNEIVAVQFNLHLPFPQATGNLQLVAERANGHTVSVRSLGNNVYTIVIVSMQNRPLKGNSGMLLTFPMHVDEAAQGGDVYNITISDAVLSLRNGKNIATESLPGTYTVKRVPTPDLIVENVALSSQQLIPGKEVTLQWSVKNIGNEITGGGWSENLYLKSCVNGEKVYVGRVYSDAVLAQGVSLPRSATVKLPELVGVDGEVQVVVDLVTTSSTGELLTDQANNTGVSAATSNLVKQLYLTCDGKTVKEGSSSPMRFRLSRSGFWDMDEAFQVTTAHQNRLSVPARVVIPKGQSGVNFYVSAANNQVSNDYLIETVKVATQNGYAAVAQSVAIEDDELMNLKIETDKTDLNEGETFTLTVTRPRDVINDTLYLSCEQPKRFVFADKVIFQKGELVKKVQIKVVDDDLADVDHTVAFNLTGRQYKKAQQLVLLKDNDVPDITLDLTPTTVNEGAGLNAIMATLRRTSATNSRITIKLTDNANGKLYYSTRTIVLEKGMVEAQFAIGVVDNAIVEKTATYDVQAAVYISSCDCSGSGTNKGIVSRQITVLDNDGPSLSLETSTSTVQEGSAQGGELTVRHNVEKAQSVVVKLTANDASMELPAQVTIPAGRKEVRVPFKVKANQVEGDSRTVVIDAVCEGYTKATCWVMVSDQTLPDAFVADFAVNTLSPEAAGQVVLKLKFGNMGVREIPAGAEYAFYRTGDIKPLKVFTTQQAIAPNSAVDLQHTIDLPNKVGRYTIFARVNTNGVVKEGLSANNESKPITLNLRAPYTVTANVDADVVESGQPVVIYGQAEGSKIANVPVEVYVLNDGGRFKLMANTDSQGKYKVIWTPDVRQMGEFVVGACYPGTGLRDRMDAFNIYGLRRVNVQSITHKTLVNEEYAGAFTLENPSNLDLHNVRVEVLDAPKNVEVHFDRISTLGRGQQVSLKYRLVCNAPSAGLNWEEIKFRVNSDEKASLSMSMHYFCRSPKGKLYSTTNKIETTMVKGESRDYSFNITNVGKGATGPISLTLPNGQQWLTAVTPMKMASLQPNESVTVILRFTPTSEMELNVPITGKIGLMCENGEGMPMNFRIETVSDKTGTLVLDVCDENTYYSESAPHLAGAKVVVKHPTTHALITQGVTDQNGIFRADLPEGHYVVGVTADDHDSFRENILVDPGKETKRIVNLSFQAIKVDWNVVETEVEDKYEIVTTVKYETHVPVPVLDVIVPDSVPIQEIRKNGSCILYSILTNKGLIAAKDVYFRMKKAEGFEFEYFVENGFTIPASQSIMVPVRVKFDASVAQGGKLACLLNELVDWSWDCGTDIKTQKINLGIKGADCRNFVPTIEDTAFPDEEYFMKYDKDIKLPPLDSLDTEYGGFSPGYSTGMLPPQVQKADVDCDACLQEKLRNVTQNVSQVSPMATKALEIEKIQVCQSARSIVGNRENTLVLFMQAYNYRTKANHFAEMLRACNPSGNLTAENPYGENLPSYMVSYLNTVKKCENLAKVEYRLYMELMGDTCWITQMKTEAERETFFGAFNTWVDDGMMDDAAFMAAMPTAISSVQQTALVERWKNTLNGVSSAANVVDQEEVTACLEAIRALKKETMDGGYATAAEWYMAALKLYEKEAVGNSSGSVCSTITLQINQTMTMTRQAFLGTLTVFNGHERKAMTDVKLTLEVTNKHGDVATAHEFQINPQTLTGFNGNLNLTDGWSLNGRETGVATIQFIPTKYAAPTVPVEYSFGGTLSYVNPYNGEKVVRDLYPVKLTVKPSPVLNLTYFMQRDIMGDNALTTDVVEPMSPSEFSLLINNIGNGDATKVNIVTDQPKIIENEKGELINFEILSSQVNGKEHTLALGGSVGADFGTIPAHSTAYAQWWLQCDLMGHFVDYDVKATHVTSYGNKDLSLLNEVTIHELIHSLRIPRAENDTLVGFLVNDITDALDTPDALYKSDGSVFNVVTLNESQMSMVKGNAHQWTLTLRPQQSAWHYGKMIDPSAGRARLVKVVRKSDGQELSLHNFWQTSYTLQDGKHPLQENLIHFADSLLLSNGGMSYDLVFEPFSANPLTVEKIDGLEAKHDLQVKPVQTVQVKFNKPIRPATFTSEDLKLTCQGKSVDLSKVTLDSKDNRNFNINFGNATETEGYYMLTVQTAQITDDEGYKGQVGKNEDWIYFLNGLLRLRTEVYPLQSGNVNILNSSSKAMLHRNTLATQSSVTEQMVAYDEPVTVVADAAQGYRFKGWYLGDELLSTESAYTVACLDHTLLRAEFVPSTCNIYVNESPFGKILGVVAGQFDYGTELKFIAVPNEGYTLSGWMINGQIVPVGSDNTYTLKVTGDTEVKAVYSEMVSEGTIGDVNNDGLITILDVSLLRDFVLGKPVEGFHEENADVNMDGTITIVDSSFLIDKILKNR